MNKSARTVLLVFLIFAAILLAPFYMGHVLGGITAGFLALGLAVIGVLAACGALVISAAGILAGFLVGCIVLLALLSPILVPAALFAGFIWLIVKLCSRRPDPPSAPAAPAPTA